MHVGCCDVRDDVTVSLNDVTSENKMMHFGHGVSKAWPPKNCLKMAIEMWPQYTQKAVCHTLPHIFGHIPATGAYNHFIYLLVQ